MNPMSEQAIFDEIARNDLHFSKAPDAFFHAWKRGVELVEQRRQGFDFLAYPLDHLARLLVAAQQHVLLAGFEGDALRLWEATPEALARLVDGAKKTFSATELERFADCSSAWLCQLAACVPSRATTTTTATSRARCAARTRPA